jgi:PPOX class probable F420-dependent enzyme
MELPHALDFVRRRREGVLVTTRANGRPQLSNILYDLGDDDVVSISVTDDRAKTKNLRRDPRASLYVLGDTFWSYVVLEGSAALSAVARDPSDAATDELVALYRRLMGEHKDWDDYRRSMVADQRLVVHFSAERAYGIAAQG